MSMILKTLLCYCCRNAGLHTDLIKAKQKYETIRRKRLFENSSVVVAQVRVGRRIKIFACI